MKIRLPKPENIHTTSDVDPGKSYYKRGIGYFMKKRLEMVLEILGNRKFDKILDLGCGSGIFLPELSTRCNELYGIDIHPHIDLVKDMLQKEGVKAFVKEGSATNIDYTNEFFDCIICISVLELIDDMDKAVDEMYRVTTKGGVIVVLTPLQNWLADFGLRMLTGIRAEEVYKGRRGKVEACLRRRFQIKNEIKFPKYLPKDLSFYICFELTKGEIN